MGRHEGQDWAKWQLNRNQRTIFVTTQKINNTTLGFNTIKHLLQNKADIETMVSILEVAFGNADKSKIKSFVELIGKYESICSRVPKLKWRGRISPYQLESLCMRIVSQMWD